MRAPRNNPVGMAAQSAVTAQFELLGWGVAPNPEHDLGTDHWVMARDDERTDIRRLVGVQVKAGATPFKQPVTTWEGAVSGWWFYERDNRHFEYWSESFHPTHPRPAPDRDQHDLLGARHGRQGSGDGQGLQDLRPGDTSGRRRQLPCSPGGGPVKLDSPRVPRQCLGARRGRPLRVPHALRAHDATPPGAPREPHTHSDLDQVLSEPGTRLGLAVSETLTDDESHGNPEPLLRRLSGHPSGFLRTYCGSDADFSALHPPDLHRRAASVVPGVVGKGDLGINGRRWYRLKMRSDLRKCGFRCDGR